MDIVAKEITCPRKENHAHKKILLVVGKDHISIHCREHGWLKIELKSNGEPINFENPSAKISSHGKGTNFILSPIPSISVGKFPLKRKYHAELSKV
jgi:hypothetical protein